MSILNMTPPSLRLMVARGAKWFPDLWQPSRALPVCIHIEQGEPQPTKVFPNFRDTVNMWPLVWPLFLSGGRVCSMDPRLGIHVSMSEYM